MWALTALVALPLVLSSWLPSAQPPSVNLTNVVIFQPPPNYTIPRTLYARTLLLKESDTLLATWENYGPEPPHFPIFESKDLGKTWAQVGQVNDLVNGWGMRYQPFLYELEKEFGGFSAGTVLCAGSSIPADLGVTQLELYASLDKGSASSSHFFPAMIGLLTWGSRTWKFVSHIVRGGEAVPDNGLTPVWEPFLMLYKDFMVYYFSDQRDPAHGQKLDHLISYDLRTWLGPTDDVAVEPYEDRPGMTTVAKLPNGKYIMTYEFYGAPEAAFAVYYKIADDPTQFNSSTSHLVRGTDGSFPIGSPYIVWSPAGGANGTLMVSSGCCSNIWTNTQLGSGDWNVLATTSPASYTRSLLVMPDPAEILLVGAGPLGGSNNDVNANTVWIA
jgi:hypothetical protein